MGYDIVVRVHYGGNDSLDSRICDGSAAADG